MELWVGTQRFGRAERAPTPEKPKAKDIGQMFDALAADYGPEVITELTHFLQAAVERGEVPQGRDIAKILTGKITRTEFSAQVKHRLTQGTFLTKNGFSLERFNKHKFADFVPENGQSFSRTRGDYLANAFGDEPVTLRNKPENGAKQLVYSPQTKEQAFDVDAIKAADFHLGYWELPDWLSKKDIKTATAPRTLDNSKALETAVAAILYNPKFGDAKRNAQGKLEVRYHDGKRHTLTADWFRAQPGLALGNEKSTGLLFDRPLAALKEYCPTLFTEGLLRDSDFTASRHQTRTRLEASLVTSKGLLSIDGVKHNLGRAFGGHTVRVEQLTPEQSAIVLDEDGVLTPISLINRFRKGDARLTTYDNGQGALSYAAPVELTQSTLLDLVDTAQNPELKAAIDNLTVWAGFNNELRAASLDVDQALPLATREHFRRNISKLAPYTEQIITLTKEIGEPGLQSIAEIADLPDIAREYLRVAAELRTSEATLLAESVIEAGSTRRQMLAEVAAAVTLGQMTPEQGRVAKYELTRRVASAITAMEDVARTATLQDKPTLDTFKQDLARRNTDLALFGSSLRTVGKEGQLSIENLQGVNFLQRRGVELTDLEQKDLYRIFDDNWKMKSSSEFTRVREKMEHALAGDVPSTFTMILYHDKIAAFIRIDDVPGLEPNALYAGSLNVDPALQDSGLGKQLFYEVLKPLAEKHTILADFAIGLDAGTSYVEDQKFVINGVDSVGQNTLRFKIRRNDKENTKYQEKSEMTKNKQTPVIFSLPSQSSDMVEYCKQMFDKGFVATRFYMPNKDKTKRAFVFEKKAT